MIVSDHIRCRRRRRRRRRRQQLGSAIDVHGFLGSNQSAAFTSGRRQLLLLWLLLHVILAPLARRHRTLFAVAELLLVSDRRLVVPAINEKRAGHDAFATVGCTRITSSRRLCLFHIAIYHSNQTRDQLCMRYTIWHTSRFASSIYGLQGHARSADSAGNPALRLTVKSLWCEMFAAAVNGIIVCIIIGPVLTALRVCTNVFSWLRI